MSQGSKNRPYELLPYSPEWAKEFQRIKSEITPLFGTELVSIEHVGSTSIACDDMWAKPNIDLCVVVNDLDGIPPLYEDFRALGYTPLGREYVGDGDEYIVWDDPKTGQRRVSVHIYQVGHPKPEIYRNFRDYLMKHNEDRARYVTLKKQLQDAHSDEYTKYDSGKTELIEEIKQKAKVWAQK